MAERPENAGPKLVIIDFDNTMGVPGCDVDDGLALLFLLGHPELVTVVGATTTYGNNVIDTVDANTRALFEELGLQIPVYRGGRDAAHPVSGAAEFLAKTAAARPGEVSVLALGSLTNLRGAHLVDPHFFANVAEIVVMGGITETLVFNGAIMDELNLACDPLAATLVLSQGRRVTMATANNCLPAFFSAEGFERRFGPGRADSGSLLWRKCAPWLAEMRRRYGLEGFHCWDVVAAAYLVRPELFLDETHDVTVSERALSIGLLERAPQGAPRAAVNQPVIRDGAEFVEEVYAGWERALELLGQGGAASLS